MTDELYDDLSVEKSQMEQVWGYLQMRDAADRQFNEEDAVNISNYARLYGNSSPELAAAVAQAKISWDNPMLGDINFDDAAEQEKSWWDHTTGAVTGAIRGTARVVGAGVEGLWEEGISRPVRTGIRAYQDDSDQSLLRSWREAGSSDAARAGGLAMRGEPVNWGTGYIPNSELAQDQPGFGQDLAKRTNELVDSGADPQMAYDDTYESMSEDFYGEVGDPVTYEGQRARSSTIIHRTLPDGSQYRTPFSFGRAAAIRVADPNSQLFNVMSGAIDATSRIVLDPINMPADEIGLAWRARNLITPVENIAEAGLTKGMRPWVNPRTAAEWFQTGRGRRMVKVLADTESTNDIRKLAGELPQEAQRRLRRAQTPEAVQNILKEFMGTVTEKAPTLGVRRTLGDKIFSSPDALSITGRNKMIGTWARRQLAESGERMVSAYEIETAVSRFGASLETMGSSPETIDTILLHVAAAEGSPTKLRAVYGEFIEEMGERFGKLGYNEDDASDIMRQFIDQQEQAQSYLADLAGHPITVEGADEVTIILPDGSEGQLPISGAHLDSEFAEHTLILPNMRDLRRATSKSRAITNELVHKRMGWDPRGLKAGRGTQVLDATQSIWRDFALMRGGWTLRVVGEEMIRRRAAGYSTMVENPAQALIAAMTDRKMVDLLGNDIGLDDYFKMKGLGASGFKRDLHNEVLTGTRFDRSRTNWVPTLTRRQVGVDKDGVPIMEWTAKGKEGITAEYVQLANSHGGRTVAKLGVTDAHAYYLTDEGKVAIKEIMDKSQGGITSKLDDPEFLMRWLESIDARIAEMGGGDYVYRNHGQTEWLTSTGEKWVDNPYDMVGHQIDSKLAELEIFGPKGGKPRGSVAERRELLLEEMGLPRSEDFLDRQFVVIKDGKDDLRKLVAQDQAAVAEVKPPASTAAARQDVDATIAGYQAEYYALKTRKTAATNEAHYNDGQFHYNRDMERIADEFDEPMAELDAEIGRLTELSDEYGEILDTPVVEASSQPVMIHDNMSKEEMVALENFLPTMYDDAYPPPAKVKSANPVLEKRLNGVYTKFVNGVFSTIMEKPTMAITRSPFAKTVYTEEMARFSIWSDDATRAKISQWAKDNGVYTEYKTAQKAELRSKNLSTKKMPKVEEPFASFEELDELAKAKAISDSKDLFYDLAQKGNWADSIRFIAPFADAWWEVMSRWGKMLGPTDSLGGMGQSIRNWERIRQGAQEVVNQTNDPTNEGWFGEDQFGNRVFNTPGIGMLSGNVRDTFRTSMKLESMMFVDPTSPRGLMLPGVGPVMQLPAQLVSPVIEHTLGQGMANDFNSFMFGDFVPGDLDDTDQIVEPLMPTWMRRTVDAFLPGRFSQMYGDEIVGAYSALLINDDPRYGDSSDEQSLSTLSLAKQIGTQLGLSRILESLVMPASQTYEPSVVVDMLNSEDSEWWLSIAALGSEYSNAKKIFGDDVVARQYVMERFGFDPLNVTTKTRGIYARPFSEDGYNTMEDNPDLKELFNYTLMAFLPEGQSPEFFGPAWQAQYQGDDPAREKMTGAIGRQVISRQKGRMAFDQMQTIYDEALTQAKGLYGEGSNELRNYRENQLDPWKALQVHDLEAKYFAWGNDKNLAGGKQGPSYPDMRDEIMGVTILDSRRRELAMDMNPEIVEFLDTVAELEGQLESASMAQNKDADWWRTSGGGLENLEMKRKIHEWYIGGIEYAITQMSVQDSIDSARWIQQRVLVPMVENVEFRDVSQEVFFPPLEPPAPTRDYVGEENQIPSIREYAEEKGAVAP